MLKRAATSSAGGSLTGSGWGGGGGAGSGAGSGSGWAAGSSGTSSVAVIFFAFFFGAAAGLSSGSVLCCDFLAFFIVSSDPVGPVKCVEREGDRGGRRNRVGEGDPQELALHLQGRVVRPAHGRLEEAGRDRVLDYRRRRAHRPERDQDLLAGPVADEVDLQHRRDADHVPSSLATRPVERRLNSRPKSSSSVIRLSCSSLPATSAFLSWARLSCCWLTGWPSAAFSALERSWGGVGPPWAAWAPKGAGGGGGSRISSSPSGSGIEYFLRM